MSSDDDAFTVGSANVYADLGLDHPELELTRDRLAREIASVIAERGLTQTVAATILGIDQPKVSAIVAGRLSGFSLERLMGFLARLDRDVEIVVRAKAPTHAEGRVSVTSAVAAQSAVRPPST